MITLSTPINKYTESFTRIFASINTNISNASFYTKRYKPAVTSKPLSQTHIFQTKTGRFLTKPFLQ